MDPNDFESREERRAAEDRIRRIREGGGTPEPAPEPVEDDFDTFEDEFEAPSRAGQRTRPTRPPRDRIETDWDTAPEPPRRTARPRDPFDAVEPAPARRSRQGMMIVGGLVVLGVMIVIFLLIISSFLGGGPSLLSRATETMTPTVEPTATVPPTAAPTVTAQAPNLALPPLTCIFQSGVGCFDYCQAAENAGECQSARSFIQAQAADPDVFFSCLGTAPGPNQGNPQDCLAEAWRAEQP